MEVTVKPRDLEAAEQPCSVTIVLSERNLLAMLSKVRREGSARQIERECPNGHFVRLIGQPDEEHYKGRVPGSVYPADEPMVMGSIPLPTRDDSSDTFPG